MWFCFILGHRFVGVNSRFQKFPCPFSTLGSLLIESGQGILYGLVLESWWAHRAS